MRGGREPNGKLWNFQNISRVNALIDLSAAIHIPLLLRITANTRTYQTGTIGLQIG